MSPGRKDALVHIPTIPPPFLGFEDLSPEAAAAGTTEATAIKAANPPPLQRPRSAQAHMVIRRQTMFFGLLNES